MSGIEWLPGDVAYLSGPGIALRTERGWCDKRGVFDGNFDARPLVVIDPEGNIEEVWNTLRDGLAVRSRDNLRDALRVLADPKPEVFRHFVLDATAKPLTSLCGKVWEFSADVIDKGACPECSRLAGNSGWLA